MNAGTEKKRRARERRARIYRKAARHIENAGYGFFSCSAIECSGGNRKESQRYAALFRPTGVEGSFWAFGWSEGSQDWETRNHCRMTALCFMAAMVEAGDA